jgi:hypothetical protein
MTPRETLQSIIQLAAWTRKEGKSRSGGLNEKGRKSYERENPGSDLKAPSKEAGNPRRASFCARMSGMKKKLTSSKTANDPDSRINKSLKAWNCSAREELNTIQLGYSNDFLSSAASGAGLVAGVGGAYATHNAIQNRGGYNAVRKKTWQASKEWLKKVGKKIRLDAREELIELAGGYVNTEDGIKREKGGHLKRHAATYIASLPLTPLAGIPVGAVIDAIRRRGNKKKTALEPTIPRELEPAMALMSAKDELDLILFKKKGGDYKRHWSQKKKPKGKPLSKKQQAEEDEQHQMSARDQLNTILLGVDTRPRDPMGRFDQAEDGAPNPNAMRVTYGTLAAGAAGGAAGAGAMTGLKALAEKLRKVKK